MALFDRLNQSGSGFMPRSGGGGMGESDALSKMASLAVLDRVSGNRLSMPRRSPLANIRPGMPSFGQMQLRDVRDRPNVVYDQGPEQFAKKLDLEKRGLDIKEKQVNALAGLKLGELGVKQQNADTQKARVDAFIENSDMSESQKAQFRAAMAKSAQDAAMGRTEAVVQGRATEGAANRGLTASEGQKNREAAQTRTETVVRGQGTRQKEAQEFEANKPGPLAQALKGRIEALLNEDPRYQSIVSWDDEAGAYRVAPPATGGLFSRGEDQATADLRAEFNRRIYGPQERSINKDKGSDASSSIPGSQRGTNVRPIIQRNPRTGQRRQSLDGGKTWTIIQ